MKTLIFYFRSVIINAEVSCERLINIFKKIFQNTPWLNKQHFYTMQVVWLSLIKIGRKQVIPSNQHLLFVSVMTVPMNI